MLGADQIGSCTAVGGPVDGERIAVVGDSYLGRANGVSEPAAVALGEAMGWRYGAFVIGGTGYVSGGYRDDQPTFSGRVSAITTFSPQRVLLIGGGNDNRFGPEAMSSAASETFERYRAALPGARITVVGRCGAVKPMRTATGSVTLCGTPPSPLTSSTSTR
jgi:hypothetical protein